MAWDNINWLLGIPIMFIVTMLITHYTFVPGTEKRKRLRWFVFASRFIILSLLLVALAGPHTIAERTEKQESEVTILVDTSASMDVFDVDAEAFISSLQGVDAIKTVHIGEQLNSPLGDALLNQLLADESILLLSDGNSHGGKSLQEVLALAAYTNTTVNAIELRPKKNDASIAIYGPRMVLSKSANTFSVRVQTVGNTPYTASILIDGQLIKSFSDNDDRVEEITLPVSPGFHVLEAKIEANDANLENNQFRKVIHALEKPEVLLVSKDAAPLETLLRDLYTLSKRETLPASVQGYYGVILDNLPAAEVEAHTEQLTTYVRDGNGLLVVGGDNALDRGNYATSPFLSLLPVHIGAAKKDNVTDLNVVLIIDISVSAGLDAQGGKVVDIEKAQALKVLTQLDEEDYIGVIAFNNDAHIIAPLKQVQEQQHIVSKIEQLQDSGGTYMETALRAAMDMLASASGNKNVIVISDGKTKNPETVVALAQALKAEGTTVHTVGIGGATNAEYLNTLATFGGGFFFSASASNQLTFVLGKEREDKSKVNELRIVNGQHFITHDLSVNAKVSGYNQIVPKTAAQTLVTTHSGFPVLVAWRFGLGRVAVLGTDNGKQWSGNLLNEENARLLARASNWVAGDPRRRDSIRISITDGRLHEHLPIMLFSETVPHVEGLTLEAIDESLYQGVLRPDEVGVFTVMNERFAVNYPREYEDIGMNPALEQLVTQTGGELLPLDPTAVVNKIKKDAIKTKQDKHYWYVYLIGPAILLLLLEIIIRRKAVQRYQNA